MTEIIQGVIKQVFNKEIPADAYENTNRLSIKVQPDEGGDEVWVSLGNTKRPGLSVKDGKNWQNVGAGSKVLCVCTRNGTYLNSKTTKVTVLALVAPQEQAAPAQRAPAAAAAEGFKPAASVGVDWAKKDAGIEAGHAINNAVQLVCSEGNGVTDIGAIPRLARQIHAMTRQLQEDILSGVVNEYSLSGEVVSTTVPPAAVATAAALQPAPTKPAFQKPPAKKAAPAPIDLVDDDIPF